MKVNQCKSVLNTVLIGPVYHFLSYVALLGVVVLFYGGYHSIAFAQDVDLRQIVNSFRDPGQSVLSGSEVYFCGVELGEDNSCYPSASTVLPEDVSFSCDVVSHIDGDELKVFLRSKTGFTDLTGERDPLAISNIHVFVQRPEQSVLKCNSMDWVSVGSGCWLHFADVSEDNDATSYQATARIYRTPETVQNAWNSFSQQVHNAFQSVHDSGSSFVDWLKEKYGRVSQGAHYFGSRVVDKAKDAAGRLSGKTKEAVDETKEAAEDVAHKGSKKAEEAKDEVKDATK